MSNSPSFRHSVQAGLTQAVANLQLNQAEQANSEDLLRIDLHCHDKNSDVPDETLGRLLRLPETWLPTETLARNLIRNGADVITVTNHNNARSCWDLLDKGEKVLPAAEFSCHFPDAEVGVHVLTFGFTPAQEPVLFRLRKDIYRFLAYCAEHDIPTSLAHPLHVYSPKRMPQQDLMDRFALCFERFEGVNGQRDAWQNLLTVEWVQGLNVEVLESASKRVGIAPGEFCRVPYRKALTGGSDCHFGLFAGSTGTLVHAPGWKAAGLSRPEAVLKALREGLITPYGADCGDEKLMGAFLDYFCQAALRMEDPGLLRLLLHRGTPGEKLLAFGIGNGLLELRRHKTTSRFLALFHECLRGRRPGFLTTLFAQSAWKPLLQRLEAIARAQENGPVALAASLREQLPALFTQLSTLLATRVTEKVRIMGETGQPLPSGAELLSRIEIPVHFRALLGGGQTEGREMTGGDLGQFIDGLPFPFLASVVLGGASFAATSVLHNHRPFVEGLAQQLGRWQHPHRVLWLTDTFSDRNGVSHVLQANLAEVRRRGLPIDFLVCEVGAAEPHLHRLAPIGELRLPFYPDQVIRLPDVMGLQRIFSEGGYDRIICSTEAPMGLMALYLRAAFHVPAFFYLHSDWIDFAKRTLGLDTHQVDRLRRFLRALYRRFDGVFVLNSEQRSYLASGAMGLDPDRIHATGHWVDTVFKPRTVKRKDVLPALHPEHPILVYAGRLSEEKGVRDIPTILKKAREQMPHLQMVIAGIGPLETWLKEEMPEACHLGWVDKQKLSEVYAAADLLLLPSWFDTFSCALLEGLACGLPAVAYNTKGPRDLIKPGINGYLVENAEGMADAITDYLSHPERAATFRRAAAERGSDFEAEPLLDQLLIDVGLGDRAVGGSVLRKGSRQETATQNSPEMPNTEEEGLLQDLWAAMGNTSEVIQF